MGAVRKTAEARQSQTRWPLRRVGVKGHFLYLLKQEVRITLQFFFFFFLFFFFDTSLPVERASLPQLQWHRWYQGSTRIKKKKSKQSLSYIYQHSKASSRVTWHLL